MKKAWCRCLRPPAEQNDSETSKNSEILKLVIPQENLKKDPYNVPEPSGARSSHSSQFYSRTSDTLRTSTKTPLIPSSRNSRASSSLSLHQPANIEKWVAEYSYQAEQAGGLSFSKGDAIIVIEKPDNGWWRARLLATQQIGFVPSNYLKLATENSLNSRPWFFGKAGRREAERQLLMNVPDDYNANDEIVNGMFLVRESQTDDEAYVLSILVPDNYQNSQVVVKHYKILQCEDESDEAIWFYITKRARFPSITSLVEYYSSFPSSETRIQQLTIPCPATVPFERGMGVWEIDRHTVKFKEADRIGGGMFGDVYVGTWTTGEREHGNQCDVKVAIKVLKNGRLKLEEFFKEATVMRSLRHPNLVSLHGVVSIDEPVMIVMEYMANSSLVHYLRSHGDSLHNEILVDITCQIANACSYMEKHEFIHRDIRAANVLVGRNLNQCKLADFGLARCVKAHSDYEELLEDDTKGIYQPKSKSKFPIRWTSPEAALYHQFSVKSDVWSFGVFMYEVASRGKVPYAGMSNTDVLKEVPSGYRLQLNESSTFPTVFNDIMQQCWIADPLRRPTFNHIFHRIHELTSQH